MSENALVITSQKSFSNLVECPGINPEQDGRSYPQQKIAKHLLSVLHSLGEWFCIFRCSKTTNCAKIIEDRLPNVDTKGNEYKNAFTRAHRGMGFLSVKHYVEILKLTNGSCPVCEIIKSLNSFSVIACYADNSPLSPGSTPCFLEYAVDDFNGFDYWKQIRHIDALSVLDVDKLPDALNPRIYLLAQERITCGKNILNFLHRIADAKSSAEKIMTDDDLWDLLGWKPHYDTGYFDGEAYLPTDKWKAWAKEKILSAHKLDPREYLCQIAMVGYSCYHSIQDIRVHRDGFDTNDGIRTEELRTLYISGMYLCGIHQSNDDFQQAITQAENDKHYFSSSYWGDRFHLNGWYYSLTFIGKKESEKIAGRAPMFFVWEEANAYENSQRKREQPKETSHSIKIATQSAAKNDATANGTGIGTGGKGGDVKVTNAPANNSSSVVEVKEGAVQNNNVVHNHIADPANLVDKILEAVKLGREMRGEHSAPIPSQPPLDVEGGENSGANPDRLIKGAVMVVVRGDVEDGDAIFQEAHIALDGARDKTRQIAFLDRNKQHDAAKRLLVHLAGIGGKLDMDAIKGICIDAGLKDTMAGNVRDQLDKQICDAAGLSTKGKDKPKAFAFNAATKEYITKLSFTIRSTIEE